MSCKARLLSPRITLRKKQKYFVVVILTLVGLTLTLTRRAINITLYSTRGHFFSSSDWEDIKEYSLVLVNLRQKYAMKN